ncbi:MAG: NAD-dependent epimerase/dehydratase family protein [Deltaproteobacteria bacterium]|jgi:UDP-glucose 4-epimerase|nr:NAD-dependent epimerase/dehydratase family protein [Deltaproteobacteria bacterium]
MISGFKICITGGSGFIGSTLVEALIENNTITVLDNFGRNRLQNLPCSQHPNLTLLKGDVLNYVDVSRAVTGADYIIHCAGIAGIDTVVKKPVETMRVNMVGSYNVLEAGASQTQCRRVICFSTSEVFGSQAFSAKETDRTIVGAAGQARWTYAVSKLAEEHLALAYFQEFNLPITVVRPFNVYGPGQIGEGALKIFIQRALNDEPLYIYGDGTQIRAWCYVDDMVKAVLKVMEEPKSLGETFNIGNPRSVETIWGLANTVIRILGSKSKIEFKPALSADIELRLPCVQKATDLLNFTAKVDLEEGILRTAAYYKEMHDIFSQTGYHDFGSHKHWGSPVGGLFDPGPEGSNF